MSYLANPSLHYSLVNCCTVVALMYEQEGILSFIKVFLSLHVGLKILLRNC